MKRKISLSKQEKSILLYLYNKEDNKIDSILHLTQQLFKDNNITNNHSKYISVYHSITSLFRKDFIQKEKYFKTKLNKNNKKFSYAQIRIMIDKDYLEYLGYVKLFIEEDEYKIYHNRYYKNKDVFYN